MRLLTVALALLLAGCQQAPTSPVAPSPTAPPAPQPQQAPARPAPTYVVNLTTNGGVAFVNEPWSGTLTVNSSDPSAESPSTVGVRCGDDPEQLFAGFVGARQVTCVFQSSGTHLVLASVVARNGVTVQNGIELLSYPRPSGPAFWLDVTSRRVNSSGALQAEYEFIVRPGTIDDTLSDMHWDFGDESGTDSDTVRVVRHLYTMAGTYRMTVTAKTGSHGIVSASTSVKF